MGTHKTKKQKTIERAKTNVTRMKKNNNRETEHSNIELHIQFGAEAVQLNPWISQSAILSLPIHLIRYFTELISINLLICAKNRKFAEH